MPKIYVRCTTCLEPCVIDASPKWRTCTCGACGGKFEFMGYIKGFEVIQPELRCVCDERCVNAMGPHCDCTCEGANHGIGMAGYYEEDKVVGTLHLRPTNVERAKARAKEYLAALEVAREIYNSKTDLQKLEVARKIKEATLSRSHGHRMSILFRLNGKLYISERQRKLPELEASDI